MEEIVGDFATLETFVVALIAIALDVIPKLKDWWATKNAAQKQVWIILIMFAFTVIVELMRCYRGACPVDWADWILVTLEAFIVNYVVANAAHFGTRHLTKAQT